MRGGILLLNLDRCSMGIYIIHHILVMLLLQNNFVRLMLDSHYFIAPIIMFIVILMISWFITNLLLKFQISKYLFG